VRLLVPSTVAAAVATPMTALAVGATFLTVLFVFV
jgi:hypothetical protein